MIAAIRLRRRAGLLRLPQRLYRVLLDAGLDPLRKDPEQVRKIGFHAVGIGKPA